MAKMTRSDVTLQLTQDEFSAINSLLCEFARFTPAELNAQMTENNILMPINHAEILTTMWHQLHS